MNTHNHQTDVDHDQQPQQEEKITPPDASSHSKLCIKIKIPNTKEEAEDSIQLHGNGFRVCEYCGKKFSSGKAWGGHKRHHLKAMKEAAIKLKKPVSKLSPLAKTGCNTIKIGDVTMSRGKPTCCLCGKDFPSWNSLFGHMRFHPDRGWKGIQPPSNMIQYNGSSSSFSSEADGSIKNCLEKAVDLLASLASWPKTDKRGRVYVSDPIPQAAHNLLKLSRDTSRSVKQTIGYENGYSSKKLKIEPESKSSASNYRGDGDFGCKGKGKGIYVPKIESNYCEYGDSEAADNNPINKLAEMLDYDNDEICNTVRKKKRKTLMMNWMSKIDEIDNTQSYGSWDKSDQPNFTRGQGSSLHVKDTSTELADESEMVDDSSNDNDKTPVIPAIGEAEESEEVEVGSMFRCDICSKTFPTGQALGGHKRRHWKAPKQASSMACHIAGYNTSSPGEASEAEKASGAASPRILGFDLNIPYIMEDEE